MNTREKGSRLERLVKKYYEKLGYFVVKSGASLGEFDLLCCPSKRTEIQVVKAIQVKSNRISKLALRNIADCDILALKECWVKKDYSKFWIVWTWDDKDCIWVKSETDI